jgi:hypothetical protein
LRALLDESLPRTLARQFKTLDVETVYDRGWAGLKNGALLRAAAGSFEIFLTADQNLRYQQNLRGSPLGVVVLAGRTNRVVDLLPLIPDAENAAAQVRPGEVRVVGPVETP